ncbi:hypothetical protein HFP15_10160 [Amycolatopsis sp. K13G38]|uniref:PE domain-containing protein n=2 Tax=Amycolatopsis acididurans TaxID=2724524 RepID=A0ABX1J1H1_9PSEU|nr:hypothetical protein [Amycolatopsis acididurans]
MPAAAPKDTLTSVPPPAPIQVGTSGSSGGYKFSPDEVQGVINKWQALLDQVEDDIQHAQKIAGVAAPGQEFASTDFVRQGASPSGQTLLQQHERMREYIRNYITALQQASGRIQQSEDEALHAATHQGQGII